MKYILNISIFLAINLVIGCQRNTLIGIYYGNDLSLEMKSDSTFIFEQHLDLNGRHSTGKWKLSGDSILLKSTYDIMSLPLSVAELIDNSHDYFIFNIGNKSSIDKYWICNYELIINDSLKYNLGDTLPQKITISPKPEYFYIRAYVNKIFNPNSNPMLQTQKYFIQNGTSNQYNILLRLDLDFTNYETIENTTISF